MFTAFFLLFFFFITLSLYLLPALSSTPPSFLPSFFPPSYSSSSLPSFLLHTFIIDVLYFIFEFYGVKLSMLGRYKRLKIDKYFSNAFF